MTPPVRRTGAPEFVPRQREANNTLAARLSHQPSKIPRAGSLDRVPDLPPAHWTGCLICPVQWTGCLSLDGLRSPLFARAHRKASVQRSQPVG